MSIKTTLNPSIYHGLKKKPPFFEGWYYKLISADEKLKVAIIPGVIKGNDAHSFIQVLNGVDGKVAYHRFDFQEFKADKDRFFIKINENQFDDSGILLNINSSGGRLSGNITLGSLNPWPVTLTSPGIMGWYAWVPRMECYHGVLSFSHTLQGSLVLDEKPMDFSNGRGYIEKDWGMSFPDAWVWFQSNHFPETNACITASVAIIPWLGSSFRGFIVGLWIDGKLYRFATYTGAKIESLQISDDKVNWIISDRNYRLVLNATRVQGGLLLGPTHLDMGKRVLETLNATVHVRLETKSGRLLFENVGYHAGLEVIGDLPRLLHG